jgi:hypothetical protein
MSTFKNPVGPQPSKVYWRRRLVVGLGLLVVIIVVWLILARPGSGSSNTSAVTSSTRSATPTAVATPKGTAVPTPSATSGSTSTPSTPAATGAPANTTSQGTCDKKNITVTAITDAAVYAANVNPMLSLSITNTGRTACTMSVGSDVQLYQITSGTELIWSSKDCQQSPVAMQQTLEPNVPVTTTPFAWQRTRSSTTTCSQTLPKVTGLGASYHLSVTVNGVKSTNSKQFILN